MAISTKLMPKMAKMSGSPKNTLLKNLVKGAVAQKKGVGMKQGVSKISKVPLMKGAPMGNMPFGGPRY